MTPTAYNVSFSKVILDAPRYFTCLFEGLNSSLEWFVDLFLHESHTGSFRHGKLHILVNKASENIISTDVIEN